jgi:hypothetical protein
MGNTGDLGSRELDRNTFLTKIDYPNHEIYGNIDQFFVPPVGFEIIEKKFREKRIIFLLGSHGCGKTFMAVKLLWNLFKDGINPVWVKWGMIDADLVRGKLFFNPQSILTENTCTYIEDPFGKIQYGWDQWFDYHELLDLVDFFARGLDNKANTYLIITSSSDVYKEFEATLLPENLAFLKANANLVTFDYQLPEFREMLTRWARYFACPWMDHDVSTKEVLRALNADIGHVSPLALKDVAFLSRHAAECSIPISFLEAQAHDPYGAAARGISMLSWQKKAFIARFFISPRIDKKRAEACLNAFSASIEKPRILSGKNHVSSIDALIGEFKDVFINEFDGVLELTTAGHFEVLDVLLDDCAEFADIFNQWLSFLALHGAGIPNLLWTAVRHYSRLKSESKRIVLGFHPGKVEGSDDDLAIPILMNYEHLPPIVQDLLIPQVDALYVHSKGDDRRSAYQVSLALYRKFPSLPTSVREALLGILTLNPSASEVPWIAVYYYDQLSLEGKQLPFKLIHDHEFAPHLAFNIGYLFHKLPDTVQALAWIAAKGDEHVQPMLSMGLFRNFSNLPPEARSLLVELAQRDMLRAKLMSCQRGEWARIPAEDLDSLLRATSQSVKSLPSVAAFIINHYNYLPKSTQSLVFELLDLPSLMQKYESRPPLASGGHPLPIPSSNLFWLEMEIDVMSAIFRHVKDLPRRVLELLLQLIDFPDVAWMSRITMNPGFADLPDDIKKELLEKAVKKSNKRVPDYDVFEQYFFSTPPDLRVPVIKKMIEEDDSGRGSESSMMLFRLLVRNLDKFDPDTKKMLVSHAREERAGSFYCFEVIQGPRPISDELIALFLEIAKKPERLEALGHRIIEQYDTLPPAIQNLIPQIDVRERVSSKWLVESILENFARLPDHVRAILTRVEQVFPEEYAAGILRSYHFAPPEIQERLPELFERAGDASRLASSLSSAISHRAKRRNDTELPRPPRHPTPKVEIRKSEKRLKAEAEMAAQHEKFKKRQEESEKQHEKLKRKYRPLPLQVEQRLLEILVSRSPSEGLVYLLVENYSVLDPATIGFLFTWAKDKRLAGVIAKAIGLKYEKSPENLKNLLCDLILSPVTEPAIGNALVSAYIHLPENVQRQIFTFARQDNMKGELALRIAFHSKELPDTVVELLEPLQDALLRRLQEDFKTERSAAWRWMGTFIWDETRVPGVRNRVKAMFEESKDEKVKQWLQLVEKRQNFKSTK